MKPRTRRLFIAIVLFAALLITIGLVIPAPERTPLPNPNAYDDFVKAGKMVNDHVSDYPQLDLEGLSELVESNREALALGRLGLGRNCGIPPYYLSPTNMVAGIVPIKRLAQAFAAEGRLAELEGRNQHAVGCFLDAIRLGNESTRGGFIIHRLVGDACVAIGVHQLKGMTNLNRAEIGAALSALTNVNEKLVSWTEIARAERRFMLGQFSLYSNPINLAGDLIQGHRATVKAKVKDEQQCARLGLLIAELAVRSYASEQGRLPEGLGPLVPEYVLKVPVDPFNGKPLRYLLQGTNWLVYSVGPNKIDNGGTNDDLFLTRP